MTLRLSPDLLAAAYDFLRQTDPFKGWKLPEGDDLGFSVIRDPHTYANFNVVEGVPTIRVSETCVGHTSTLLAQISHEMCHLRQHLRGEKDAHGASFKRMAASVCKAHGFDPKTF